jgi:hypothetical protein
MRSIKVHWINLILSMAIGLIAPLAFAADAKPVKRTNVDFEDQLVQGEVKKPELFYLLQKKQFNFGKLIKLRENFVPEMTQTAEELQKVGAP